LTYVNVFVSMEEGKLQNSQKSSRFMLF
jgi:hypothetical protein